MNKYKCKTNVSIGIGITNNRMTKYVIEEELI